MRCLATTKAGTQCKRTQKGEYCSFHRQVGGRVIPDFIANRFNFLQGVRTNFSQRFNDWLNTYSRWFISRLYIGRKPVNSLVQSAMNVLSAGNFNKTKNELGYENIWHYFLVIEIKHGRETRVYKVEKNHIVEAKNASSSDLDHSIPIIPQQGISLGRFIHNAAQGEGKEFYVYNPADSNCETFVRKILSKNNIAVPPQFSTEQNGRALIDSLGILKNVPKAVTDFANVADRAVYGDGVRSRGKKKIRKLR